VGVPPTLLLLSGRWQKSRVGIGRYSRGLPMCVRSAQPARSEMHAETNPSPCRLLKQPRHEREARISAGTIAMKKGPLIIDQRTLTFEVIQILEITLP